MPDPNEVVESDGQSDITDEVVLDPSEILVDTEVEDDGDDD